MEAPVRRIVVDIVTAFGEGAGTQAPVYLGLGGREFRLDLGQGGFEEGSELSFQLGEDATVKRPERNDPRLDVPLSVAEVVDHPVYLRLAPRNDRDDWRLASACVRIHTLGERRAMRYSALDKPGEAAWLGIDCGTILHLHRVEADRLEGGECTPAS